MTEQQSSQLTPVPQEPSLQEALHDAATSLETIASMAGRKGGGLLETFLAVRGYANSRAIAARAALAQPAGGAPKSCPHCDDTGDVHRADGEWLGRCTCPAATGVHPEFVGMLQRLAKEPDGEGIHATINPADARAILVSIAAQPAGGPVEPTPTRDVADVLHFCTPQQMAEEIVRLDALLAASPVAPLEVQAGEPMREALEYVKSYLQERSDWRGTEPLIGDINRALAAHPESAGTKEMQSQ